MSRSKLNTRLLEQQQQQKQKHNVMISSQESTTISSTSTMNSSNNNQLIVRKPLGLPTDAICDPFWSCLLQDFSEDEEDDNLTFVNLMSVQSGDHDDGSIMGNQLGKKSSSSGQLPGDESKEGGDDNGANGNGVGNTGNNQAANKKIANRLRAWTGGAKKRWQNARQKTSKIFKNGGNDRKSEQ